MPRCCSIFIQSERARLASPRAFTAPATWMAPPNSSSFSVRVVLPASGWEMIANVRRRPAGWPARRESSSETTAESGTFRVPGGVRGGSGASPPRQLTYVKIGQNLGMFPFAVTGQIATSRRTTAETDLLVDRLAAELRTLGVAPEV